MSEVSVEITDAPAEELPETPTVVVVNTEPGGERVDAVTVDLARENATLEAENERLTEEVAEVAEVAETALETAVEASAVAHEAILENVAEETVLEEIAPDEVPGGRLHWAHRSWHRHGE